MVILGFQNVIFFYNGGLTHLNIISEGLKRPDLIKYNKSEFPRHNYTDLSHIQVYNLFC